MNLKNNIIFIGFVLFMFYLSVYSEPVVYKPKVFGYIESGERWVEPTDDDYEAEVYTTETYYKYKLTKVGFSQKLNKNSLFSLSFKLNNKDYQNVADYDLSNITKTLFGYIRFKLSDPLTFKLEGNVRQASFDLTESQFKENDWAYGAISLTFENKERPAQNLFFNTEKNRYLLKLGYKRQTFPNNKTNNANSTTVLLHWDYKFNQKLIFKSKARLYRRDYEFISSGNNDSTKCSYQVGAEYQF